MAKGGQTGRCALMAVRVVIGGIFLLTGALKAFDPDAFLLDIQSYRLLPYRLEVATAVYLPWLEILCGLSLVLGRFCYRGSLAISMSLMVVFATALTSAWTRGLNINCGCFGSWETYPNYPWLLARDLVLLAGMVIVWNSTSDPVAKQHERTSLPEPT